MGVKPKFEHFKGEKNNERTPGIFRGTRKSLQVRCGQTLINTETKEV